MKTEEKKQPANAVEVLATMRYNQLMVRSVAGMSDEQAIVFLEELMADPNVIQNDSRLTPLVEYWIYAVDKHTTFDHSKQFSDPQSEVDRLLLLKLEALKRLHNLLSKDLLKIHGREIGSSDPDDPGNFNTRRQLIKEMFRTLICLSPAQEKMIVSNLLYILKSTDVRHGADFEKMVREVYSSCVSPMTTLFLIRALKDFPGNTLLAETLAGFLTKNMFRNFNVERLIGLAEVAYWFRHTSPEAMNMVRLEAAHLGRLSVSAQSLKYKLVAQFLLVKKDIKVTCLTRDILEIEVTLNTVSWNTISKTARKQLIHERINEIGKVVDVWRSEWNLYLDSVRVHLRLLLPPVPGEAVQSSGTWVERIF